MTRKAPAKSKCKMLKIEFAAAANVAVAERK